IKCSNYCHIGCPRWHFCIDSRLPLLLYCDVTRDLNRGFTFVVDDNWSGKLISCNHRTFYSRSDQNLFSSLLEEAVLNRYSPSVQIKSVCTFFFISPLDEIALLEGDVTISFNFCTMVSGTPE